MFLYQNVPNPTYSSTDIRYKLTELRYVTLSVYDNYGRQIKTLVEESQGPGIYSVTFNTEDLPGGLYFYRLTAGKQVAMGKIVKIE